MTNELVKYSLDNGQDIEVTEQDVRDLLSASGQVAQNVTAQEIKTFMRLCQAQRLNPFTKDAYIVKYGNSPATIITGKEAFTKRAFRHPKFRGMEAGVTIIGTDGRLHRRDGSLLLVGEKLVGGWCRVCIDGYEKPMFDEVSIGEYSTGKGNWQRIPATMIRKVAITHALREAFPEDLGGLYGEEEMDQAEYEEPQPSQPRYQKEEEPEVIVECIVEEPEASQPQPDPRKQLWKEVAELKAQAIDLGTNEEGITSWMAVNILNQDGSPKPTNLYTVEDIKTLREFLAQNIQSHEQLAAKQQAPEEVIEAEYTELDYSIEDIPF